MNSFFLLIPFILVRYGLITVLSKDAMKRAAYFPPQLKTEKAAYWIYQLSTAAILVYMLFLKIETAPIELFYAGLFVCAIGLVLCILTVIDFSKPSQTGINVNGLYRVSRNPMYIAFFIYFIGCVLLTQSLLLLGFVLIFQITEHWMILSEERWCVQEFGEEYRQYMKKVRRYI